MKTNVGSVSAIEREWHKVDANGMVLGRLASRLSKMLSGKNKVAYSPNHDHGDYIIVVNAGNIRLTGKKTEAKTYFRHSMYPGGGKFRSFKEQMAIDPTQVVRRAVRGMLPKTRLGRAMLEKLFVYAEDTHPHAAQKPKALALN